MTVAQFYCSRRELPCCQTSASRLRIVRKRRPYVPSTFIIIIIIIIIIIFCQGKQNSRLCVFQLSQQIPF